MDRAGLITLEQARAAGLSFDEPEPRACPHCGAALEPLGAGPGLAKAGSRTARGMTGPRPPGPQVLWTPDAMSDAIGYLLDFGPEALLRTFRAPAPASA